MRGCAVRRRTEDRGLWTEDRGRQVKKTLREIEWKARALFERVLFFFVRAKKLDAEKLDLSSLKSVLVVRQHNELGDMLISSPMFRALKEKFPRAKVVCVAAKANLPVARGIPFIDEVVHYDSKMALRNPFYFIGLILKLRSQRFDAAIVPCTVSFSLTSAVIAALSGAKVKIGGETEDIFYKNGAMFFNVYLKIKKAGRPQVDINLDYLKPLGIEGVADRTYSFSVKEGELEKAAGWLAGRGILPGETLIGVHPGAGKLENRWGAANFASLINLITENRKAKVLVFYGPGEESLKDELVSGLKQGFTVLDPVPLLSAAAFMKKCSLFVCNDTGVLHVAAALGVKTFAVFGKGSPALWNPPGEGHFSVWDPQGVIGNITPAAAYDEFTKQTVL